MDEMEIKPLILDMVGKHCKDQRVKRVVIDVLQEQLQQQYFNRQDWNKYFNKRYKECILERFKEDLE